MIDKVGVTIKLTLLQFVNLSWPYGKLGVRFFSGISKHVLRQKELVYMKD